jgi:hypothetical protein
LAELDANPPDVVEHVGFEVRCAGKGDMLGRLFVGALVWLAAVALVIVGLQDSARARRLGPAYVITRTASYQRVTVVNAKIRRGANRQAVAAAIVKPLRDTHDEVLIYLEQPAQPGKTTLRRVQWSRDGGFSELLIH